MTLLSMLTDTQAQSLNTGMLICCFLHYHVKIPVVETLSWCTNVLKKVDFHIKFRWKLDWVEFDLLETQSLHE